MNNFHPKSILNNPTSYVLSLIPAIGWLPRYNRKWFIGDVVSGITVGLMVAPQSLAYAKLANLPVVYGLYSSFMGTMIYSMLGSCREIAVGPAAVLSLMVGSVITKINQDLPHIDGIVIAATICFLSGIITLGLGLFKLGLILDWIPHPVIMGFTTGSAMIIILSQVPNLLGIPNVPSSDPTITIVKNVFTNLVHLNYPDLVFGLLSLGFLMTCTFISRKYKKVQSLSVASNALCVLVFTIISFAISNNQQFKLKVVGSVPQGLPKGSIPTLNDLALMSHLLPEMIPVILVGVLEHVSIAKSFARANNYKLFPSQELVALGAGNLFTSFIGGYPATGSFSRTAVNSRSGVQTPLSGLWTGLVVLLALWVLTPAFYYIPSATLSAIIILSAKNLVTTPTHLRKLFVRDIMEGISFSLATLITLLVGAELGIGCSVAFSLLVLLFKLSRPSLIHQPIISHPANTHFTSDRKNLSVDDGWLLFQPQGDLLFTSIDSINDQVLSLVKKSTQPSLISRPKNKLWNDNSSANDSEITTLPKLSGVILDLTAAGSIDGSGLQGLTELINQLQVHANYENDISDHNQLIIRLVITNQNVIRAVNRAGLLVDNELYSSVNDAIAKEHGVTSYSIKDGGFISEIEIV